MTFRPTSEPQHLQPSEETVDAVCPSHGAFLARVIRFDGMSKPMVGRCPTCSEEIRAAEEARKAREIAAERAAQVAHLRSMAGIPARFAAKSFDDYQATTVGQKIALGVCRTFAENWPAKLAEGGSLVLTGGPGTGKTHLACAVANAVIEQHLASAGFGTVAGLLRHIKDTYRKDSQKSEQDAIDDLVSPRLLVVDEVGVQVGSEHEKLLMFEVLNARYQSLRPTILISNLSGGELEAFLGQRLMDRYRECGSVLAFDWQSHRGTK